MLITEVAVRNRTTVWVVMLLIAIGGAYCYLTIPREAAPDVQTPYVVITTTYEGVSPEEMESTVTMKLETKLSGVDGLKKMTSSSAEGLSSILCEFYPGIQMSQALQRVRDRVDIAKGDLPADANQPTVQEINIAEFPIMMLSIAGETSPTTLKAIADNLKDEIEKVPGVLECQILGALEREIRVEIDPDRLAAYNLTLAELLQLVPSENVNTSAGGLETAGTKFNIRVPGAFVQPEEIQHLLLTVRNGKPIYLLDVGQVRDTFKDPDSISRLDGKPSVTLAIKKRVGANILLLSEGVKYILAEARKQAPAGVRFELTLDESKFVRTIVKELENEMASGALLVIVVMVLFMGWRTSFIVVIAMPLSMLMGFMAIAALGYTLNMIVLFSLVLVSGRLVDDAIVIVENIYRHRQIGYSRIDASVIATREVGWAVTTSTLTTVAAFLPLLFWSGIMGDFMKYLPVTVCCTLLSSLFVAMVISPVVCATFIRDVPPKSEQRNWFVRGYRQFQGFAVEHHNAALIFAFALLVTLGTLYAKLNRGTQFMGDIDTDQASITITCPQGTNIHETDNIARQVEQRIEKYREDYDYVTTDVGSGGGGEHIFAGSSGPHLANITVIFHDYAVRKTPSASVIEKLRRDVADISGAEIRIAKQTMGPPAGADVEVQISGKDMGVLGELNDKVKREMAAVPGLVDVRSDLEATRPELAFSVDRRRAMLMGVNTAIIGRFLKTAVFGMKVGTYREYNDEYDITVRLPLSHRTRIDDILRLRLPNFSGNSVPLSSLGKFDYRGGFGTIHRVNQKRVISVTGAAAEGFLPPAVLKSAQERLKKLELPQSYAINYAGQNEMMQENSAFLSKALVIGVFLIALVLITQFNSMFVPLIIMTTVVLSLIGALTGLIISGLPFSIIMTGLGIISLAGVVVPNAIVLLDYTRKLQARGLSVKDAVAQAGETRLRPVLLTASATVVGLIPIALGMSYDFHRFVWEFRSESAIWWQNMSVVVIFGMTFGTILTLVVVPAAYVALDGALKRIGLKGLEVEQAAPPSDSSKRT